jgi:hypothetical protein
VAKREIDRTNGSNVLKTAFYVRNLLPSERASDTK